MAQTKFTRLELQIMQALWDMGKASIREIQEAFPERDRPAYTTIQTTVYRLEGKKALRRVKKISNAHIFEPMIARDVTRHRLLDEILSLFGGRLADRCFPEERGACFLVAVARGVFEFFGAVPAADRLGGPLDGPRR